MRQIRLKIGFVVGDGWKEAGAVIEVDDFRAARLVELGHAEHVAQVAVPLAIPPVQRATAPRASETARAK
jgi:hypothetical protein